MSSDTKTVRLKPTTATGVTCKGCHGVHFYSGMREQMEPYKHISGKYSIRCPHDGVFYEYDLNEQERVYKEEPPSTSDNQELVTRIIEIENRLTKLETKTAELPDKEGIKQLKEDFAGFLANALKASGKGAAYG